MNMLMKVAKEVCSWAAQSTPPGITRGGETDGRPRGWVCALALALLFPWSAVASVSTSDLRLFIVVSSGSPNDPQYTSNPGGFYNGVARLDISVPGDTLGCSGALIDPTHVLTAAHCVEPALGITGINVQFESGSAYAASGWVFDSLWDSLRPYNGNDLGIVTLATPATGITPYTLFLDAGLGMNVDIAGYGISDYQTGSGWGTFRHGPNQYDESNNAIYGFHFGSGDVMTCEGDSGGPTFINGALAGVHSYGDPGCTTFGADIPVARAGNLAFIRANSTALNSVPEPSTFLIVGCAMCVGMRSWRRRRR